MELKKISLKRISEVLSEKEMKNVMGGSGVYDYFQCYHGDPKDASTSHETACNFSFDMAVSYCQAWAGLGHSCRCYSC